MAFTQKEKLADTLAVAATAAIDNILQSAKLSGPQRTLLIKEGFLKPIIKGWYLLDADLEVSNAGESVLWYEGLWCFVGQYISTMYGDKYWLNPEDSLAIQTGNSNLPQQLMVSTSKAASNVVTLPNQLSLCVVGKAKCPDDLEYRQGVMVHTLASALANLLPKHFKTSPTAIQIGLAKVDTSQLALAIASSKNKESANRLLGAFIALDMPTEADIFKTQARAVAGFDLIPKNPFSTPQTKFTEDIRESPSAMRIREMWARFREDVAMNLKPLNRIKTFLRQVLIVR